MIGLAVLIILMFIIMMANRRKSSQFKSAEDKEMFEIFMKQLRDKQNIN